jgi:hypothetical protein
MAIMDNSGEIKIRTLPRGNEKDGKKSEPTEKPKTTNKPPRWIIYVGVAAVALGAFTFLSKGPMTPKQELAAKAKAKKAGQMELASTNARINDNVTRHLQDAQIQRDLMKRTREMENAPFRAELVNLDEEETLDLPDQNTTTYGVQLDGDGAAERVFEDLDVNRGPRNADLLPGDKINARIANRKWLTEMERAEKIQFISNFIRSAYDRGYEVEIDQNLVVVGVKKINQNKILDINQVIDRLAKGQQPGAG